MVCVCYWNINPWKKEGGDLAGGENPGICWVVTFIYQALFWMLSEQPSETGDSIAMAVVKSRF